MEHPLHKLIKLCQEDLARQLQLDVQNVDFVTANGAMWQDASLSIPDGIYYPPTPVPGYIIVLLAGGKHYQYHTDVDVRIKQFKIL